MWYIMSLLFSDELDPQNCHKCHGRCYGTAFGFTGMAILLTAAGLGRFIRVVLLSTMTTLEHHDR